MYYYLELAGDNTIIQQHDYEEALADIPTGWVEISSPVSWNRPYAQAVQKWINGASVWVDERTLETLQASSIAKTYEDVDKVVKDAVGNRTEEYKDAEVAAQAYKAAGYTGTVPADVQCYATHNPTGAVQTGQWAADDILGKATAYAQAKLAMREQRFASQSAMRAATTNAEIDSAVAVWDGFIANVRTQIGI